MTESGAYPASQIRVRFEEAEDVAAIRRVNEAAFGGTAEAAIVDAVRAAGAVVLSMVAVIGAEEAVEQQSVIPETASVTTWGGEGGWGEPASAGEHAGRSEQPNRPAGGSRVVGGQVVGHVLITEVTVSTERGEVPLLGLGPLGVLPKEQGQGVGTLLVEACLEQLRESGRAGVVVVGGPGYYSRFGFIPASRWGLRWEMDVPDDVFMALELSPGRLPGVRGVVHYRPEFGCD